MSYSKVRLKAMIMKQLLIPEQPEQVIYQMLPYPAFATRFIEGHLYKSQQIHWYSRYTVKVTLSLNL